MSKLVLASGSPRRREILTNQNIPFTVVKSGCEEFTEETEPSEVVRALSLQKGLDVAASEADAYILAADTVVAANGEILGKPVDEEDAKRMLRSLQGKSHQVYTGVTLIKDGKVLLNFAEKTDVHMYPMSEQEIADYVASKEPMDKAGSYAIQGLCAVHVEKIDGDYNNVVGLPMARIYQECKKLGIDLRKADAPSEKEGGR